MTFLQSHGLDALLAYFVFSAIVSGMPEPTASSRTAYKWAFHSLSYLSGDLSRLLGSRIPKP